MLKRREEEMKGAFGALSKKERAALQGALTAVALLLKRIAAGGTKRGR